MQIQRGSDACMLFAGMTLLRPKGVVSDKPQEIVSSFLLDRVTVSLLDLVLALLRYEHELVSACTLDGYFQTYKNDEWLLSSSCFCIHRAVKNDHGYCHCHKASHTGLI